jgi:valacyclovir hydrolase
MPFVNVGATEIYYEEWGAGAPLLLLHGFSESGRDMAPLAQAFGAHYRVLTPDMPGYGQSGPQARDYTVDFYEDDARVMAGFLDALHIRQAHIAGFSDGGEVALWLAILRPDLARTVVAWGVAGALDPALLPEIDAIGHLIDAPHPDMAGWGAYLREAYGVERAARMTAGWAGAVRQLIERGGDISLSRAAEVRCPVLIINGENDHTNPPAAGQRLAATIPQATLHTVPGVGHAVHDARPDWFVGTVRDWLAQAA